MVQDIQDFKDFKEVEEVISCGGAEDFITAEARRRKGKMGISV